MNVLASSTGPAILRSRCILPHLGLLGIDGMPRESGGAVNHPCWMVAQLFVPVLPAPEQQEA